MLLLPSLVICLPLLMMLLLPLMILVHLVTSLRHRAAAAKYSGIEIPVNRYPIGGTYDYPDLSGLKERLLEDDYIVLDDDLCRELGDCDDSDPGAVNKLLSKHSMKNKFAPVLNF